MNNCCRYSLCNRDTLSSNNNINSNVMPTLASQNLSNNCDTCGTEDFVDALCNLIGRKCNCEFATPRGLEAKCGILERVGNDFLVLRSLNNNRLMYCSLCDLIFITIIC